MKEHYRTWFPDDTPSQVAAPDGAMHLGWYDGSGSWIANSVDLLRYLSGIDLIGNDRERLKESTITDLLMMNQCVPKYYDAGDGEYHDYESCADLDKWYGAGFRIRATNRANTCTDDDDCPVGQRCESDDRCTGRGLDWHHTGSLNGSRAYLYRRSDGVSWAFLGNSIPPADDDISATDSPWSSRIGDWSWYNINDYTLAIKDILMDFTDDTEGWPNHDLFSQFPLPSTWMNASDFQDYYMAMSDDGKWTSSIEVEESGSGQLQYRGRFAPKIPGIENHARFGKNCQDFKAAHEQYTEDGLELVHMNAIVHEGTRRYQGVWMSPINGGLVPTINPGGISPSMGNGFRP